ncbi:cache domain-containing sensor histidine kinase [Aquibacillus albus]|uniref:histidine kinase n=1 Tax=Aquibacillus albus TaxID=1168171 RepID=A0ABS2MW08_9BACI|nr:sensor histidine kinase [Aquibacillus albus]MBM7570079.1 sensor histidine kinase YesM [Aquibacillus albus]
MKALYRKLNIRNKIFLTFAMVYIIVITIIGIFIYVNNINQMKNQAQEMSKVLSSQFTQTIDLYIDDIERLSLAIFTDSYIQNMLMNYESNQNILSDLAIRNKLYPNLFSQTYPIKSIEGITIYTNSGTMFQYDKSGGMRVRYGAEEKNWITDLNNKSKSDFILIPTHSYVNFDGNEHKVVSLARHIYEIPQRKKIGTVKIDIDIAFFDKLLELKGVEYLKDYMKIIILTNDSVIYSNTKELIGKNINLPPLSNLHDEKSEFGELKWNGANYLLATDQSDYTNWTTLTLIEDEFIKFERKQIILFIVVSGIITIIIIAAISYLLSYNIAKPFSKMMKKMKRVEKGDLAERMDLSGNTEMDVIARVYNSMLDSIHKLITEVYEASIAEKNAKISALQSQINPHFLYNTLNVMKSISRVKGVEQVAEISESLAELFKYSMRNLDQPVTLQEEMKHIENYIRIQKHRFRDRFILTQHINEDVKNTLIPKLLIQPIVENAVNHGFINKKSGGIIEIIAFNESNSLVIIVADNGQGMDNNKLSNVLSKVNKFGVQSKESGIGLNNIAQRIRLMYGAEYRIAIESEVGIGTTVILNLPLNIEKMEGEN